MNAPEAWRPVPAYEAFYEVSSHGNVRRITDPRRGDLRNLLGTVGKAGYRVVTLCRPGAIKTVPIHILVAAAFLGPRPDGFCAHHRDGSRNNNCLSNLEYVTNGNHRRLHRRSYKKILSWDEACCVRALAATTGMKQGELAEFFGVSRSLINGIVTGRFCARKYPDDEVDSSRRQPNEMQEALALIAGA